MLSKDDLYILLDELEGKIADELESQKLDFKRWKGSIEENIKLIIENAVCMANGGGGSVVFGVADRLKGRSQAILGVPANLDITIIVQRVYERTDPHITPVFELVDVPEGTGKILVMNILPGLPPYTTTDGKATIRQGDKCIPFTGTLRRQMVVTSNELDLTKELVYEDWKSIVSATALEKIRDIMKREKADISLLEMPDEDLLNSIGALKDGYLTKGAILLVGKPEVINRIIPEYRWSFRKMISDTDYSLRDDGTQAIPIALYELERYISVDNTVVTIEAGLVHPEFSTYPIIALRESLLNAFGHRDYRLPGTIMLKQYKDKLVLTNPGNFIGGITEKNILHHPPVTRNDHLMDLLDRLKLVNRSNLGVSRIYRSLLLEGKEPPIYNEVGNNIELTFIASPLKTGFKDIVDKLIQEGKTLDVDHLLILQYLLRHEQIDTNQAAEVSQRGIYQARELLSKMENEFELIEAIGRGKGKYYTLTRFAYNYLADETKYERNLSLDKEAIKMRILSILKQKKLTNKEIRSMTGLDTKQVFRLIKELEVDGVIIEGRGPGTRYRLKNEVYN